jgi:hypothetical protein
MIKFQLFKSSQSEAGYLDKGGAVVKDLESYYITSDFMEVTPGATVSYDGLSYIGSEQRGCYYDINQNFVSYFDLQVGDTTMIVPSGCYYARVTVCKKTKMNLFYDTLEAGSINDISGSNEAGVTFTRSHGDTITIGDSDLISQLVLGGEYTISTSIPVYQVMMYYYRSTATGIKYDHCEGTEFNVKLQQYTFTVPDNIDTYKYVRFKFYTPNRIHDFKVMLNSGDYVLDYTEPTLIDSDDSTTFQFYILQEAYESFRNDLYNYMKLTLSPNLTEKDLDTIIKLMCYIFGDLTGIAYALREQTDPDKAEESYLKHLGSVIGYEWNDALTADQQREAMKLFVDIRKRRGSLWSMKNLISVFGQDRISYYSSSDMRGINIIEGGKDGEPIGTADSDGLYPGDFNIEIPQFSTILREAIDNIRLIGTRIIFTYVLYIGVIKMISELNCGREIVQWFDPAYYYDGKYNLTIKEWIDTIKEEFGEEYTLEMISTWPVLHRITSAKSNCYLAISINKKTPYEKGYIWHEQGNTNYQGFLIDDETLKDEDTMYGYDHS